jgi:hypothetical protein
VVAADRVVVGDRAAGGDERVRRGGLDLRPLLDLVAAARRGEDGVVRRRAVGIDVGEAAGDERPLARGLARRAEDLLVEGLEALPGDRRLERLAEDPDGHERVAQVRRAQERAAPRADRAAARVVALLDLAAVLAGDRERAGHRRPDVVVGRLEAEDEDRPRAVARAGVARLGRVDEPAVRRAQPPTATAPARTPRPRGRSRRSPRRPA